MAGAVVLDFKRSVQDPNSLHTTETMYAQLGDYATERMFGDIPPDELLLETVVEKSERTGRPIGVEANYELRFAELPFSEGGVVGRITHEVFAQTIRHTWENLFDRLSREQPNCNWQVVAAAVVQDNLARLFDVSNGEGGRARPGTYSAQQLVDRSESMRVGRDTPMVEMKPARTHAMRTDYRAMLQLAIVDSAKAELVDPWFQTTRTAGHGLLQPYIDNPQLRYLPPMLAKERAAAKGLIERYHANVPTTFEAEPEADDKVEITETMCQMALLGRDQGWTWGKCAESLGVANEKRLARTVNAYAKAQVPAAE